MKEVLSMAQQLTACKHARAYEEGVTMYMLNIDYNKPVSLDNIIFKTIN